MRGRTDLGPACPVCGSGEWRLDAPRADFHRDGVPRPEVSAEARCVDCEGTFYLDLAISDDSIWRSSAVPRSMGPLVAFGWLDDTLYAAGRSLNGEGAHYHEEYRVVDVRVPEK
jgi:hypothetical protein